MPTCFGAVDDKRCHSRELAPRAGSFDVVHARFALMHRDELTGLAASLSAGQVARARIVHAAYRRTGRRSEAPMHP
jgi:hypothetical protein